MTVVEVNYKNRVKVGRAENNFSQEKLAELVGISRQSLGLIEAGKHIPSVTLAYKIAKALNMDYFEVFIIKEVM